MRRLVEVVRRGKTADGEWSSVTYEPKPTVLDRVPAFVELLCFGVVIGLPALVVPILISDQILGPVVGLAGSAILAAITPRFYHSRAERESDIELDETELRQNFQQRQIDTLTKETRRDRRR
jgi:hypothetical protein